MTTIKLFPALILAFTPVLIFGQQKSYVGSPEVPSSIRVGENIAPVVGPGGTPDPTTETSASVRVTATASPKRDEKALTERWLDLESLTHSQRYRNAFDDQAAHVFQTGQQRSLVAGRIKIDSQARYTIGFRATSGRYFNWSYADYIGPTFATAVVTDGHRNVKFTPAELNEFFASLAADPSGVEQLGGIQSAGWEFYVRELFLSATPVKAVTLEFGSFGIERGLSSEITTFDEDGYLSGERVRLRAPKQLFFDQIGFTNAYFGDFITPNFFARGGSLKKTNYRQFFLDKTLTSRVGLSGEYTWMQGTNTLRQAVSIKVEELKVVDSFRMEAYQRLNTVDLQGLQVAGGAGFAVAAKKKITSRLDGELGFASIDKDYTVYTGSRFFHSLGFSLNGDSYSEGKRPFAHASYKLAPGVVAYGFYTHQVGTHVINLDGQNLYGGITVDLKALINREKKVF